MTEQFICSICQENNDLPRFKLPECSHEFHCECIIHWFRHGNTRCPLCNNEGHVNNIENDHSGFYRFSRYTRENKVKFLKKYAKRRNCDPLLKEYITKIKKLEQKDRDVMKEETEFKKKFKGTFVELRKKETIFRQKRRRIQTQIHHVQREMCNFPISELIVVRRLTLMDD